jgi:type IV secretory pathway component VirB8
MADAVYFRNLRKRERSASTLAGIFRCRRRAAVLHLVLLLPFQPFTLFAVGISAGCALIEASTDLTKFI